MATDSLAAQWDDAAALAALLARLGANAQEAGQHYEGLRARLIALMRLHQPADAESLADEALTRLARRLHEGVVVENIPAYLHGIARLVVLEALKAPLARRAGEGALAKLSAEPAEVEADTAALAALRHCLAQLGSASQRLILDYYGASEAATPAGHIAHRQQLAAELGLQLNALRNRALRLRAALEQCIKTALLRDELPPNAT